MTIARYYEAFKNILPIIVAILGAIWALWTWGFSEWLRRKKEMPAIEGKIDVKTIPNSASSTFVTIIATWKNRSPLPFPINTDSSGVDIFSISQNTDIGVVGKLDSLNNPFISYRPYDYLSSVTLLPMTENVILSHFLLENNNTYLFRWQLFGKKYFFWQVTELLHLP